MEEWNFNQLEAHAAFSAAAAEDPTCSRCWWGISYALGPGANRCAAALWPHDGILTPIHALEGSQQCGVQAPAAIKPGLQPAAEQRLTPVS